MVPIATVTSWSFPLEVNERHVFNKWFVLNTGSNNMWHFVSFKSLSSHFDFSVPVTCAASYLSALVTTLWMFMGGRSASGVF